MTHIDLIDKRGPYDRILDNPERVFVALLFIFASVGWWLDPGRSSDFGNPQQFAYLTATLRTLYIVGGSMVLAGLLRGRRNLEAAGNALMLCATTTGVLATIIVSPAGMAPPAAARGAILLIAAVMFLARLLSTRRPLKAELRPVTSGSIVLKADPE